MSRHAKDGLAQIADIFGSGKLSKQEEDDEDEKGFVCRGLFARHDILAVVGAVCGKRRTDSRVPGEPSARIRVSGKRTNPF